MMFDDSDDKEKEKQEEDKKKAEEEGKKPVFPPLEKEGPAVDPPAPGNSLQGGLYVTR